MADIKYRIGFGNNADDINNEDAPVLLPPFTADCTTIFADSTIRKADETK